MATNKPTAVNKTSTLMNVLTVLLLLFITPIGLIVMWFGTKWSKTVKIVLTVVLIILMLVIIPIIAVVGLAVFVGIQGGSRDNLRMQNVQEITKALEINYNVESGIYPAVKGEWFTTGQIPQDPLGESYEGIPTSPVKTFKICANLELQEEEKYCLENYTSD